MNTILSLFNFLNITEYYDKNNETKYPSTQYYSDVNIHPCTKIAKYNSELEYIYKDELYNYQLIQRKILEDKTTPVEILDNETTSELIIEEYEQSMEKKYEIHGDRVLINAYYYTFWISIDEFKKIIK